MSINWPEATAQSVSVVAKRMRLPSVILQLIKRKYNYKTKLSITKILNWDWLFAIQFLECQIILRFKTHIR